MTELDITPRAILIDYTNWKGVRKQRWITPLNHCLWWGSTEWHKEEQWLLRAIDGEDGKVKDFALLGIHSIESSPQDRG